MNKRRDGWTNVGGGTHKKHEDGRHVYRTSPSGRFIEKDHVPMTSAKGEHVVIYRDRHTGRFTTRKSAKHIEKVSKASAESLKRLAKR